MLNPPLVRSLAKETVASIVPCFTFNTDNVFLYDTP